MTRDMTPLERLGWLTAALTRCPDGGGCPVTDPARHIEDRCVPCVLPQFEAKHAALMAEDEGKAEIDVATYEAMGAVMN
jgi:hypothetical protein